MGMERQFRKLKVTAAILKCIRCGRMIKTPDRSLTGADKTFQKYYNICPHCITPGELAEIDAAIAARFERMKPHKPEGVR